MVHTGKPGMDLRTVLAQRVCCSGTYHLCIGIGRFIALFFAGIGAEAEIGEESGGAAPDGGEKELHLLGPRDPSPLHEQVPGQQQRRGRCRRRDQTEKGQGGAEEAAQRATCRQKFHGAKDRQSCGQVRLIFNTFKKRYCKCFSSIVGLRNGFVYANESNRRGFAILEKKYWCNGISLSNSCY